MVGSICPETGLYHERVRFAVQPAADESLAGLILRTAEAEVLASSRTLVAAFGAGAVTPTTLATTAATAPVMATMLGVSQAELESRLLKPVADTPVPLLAFFGTAIRRSYRSTQLRRVAPAALRQQPYHRALAELAPITFCPETWQLLTGHCLEPECGAPLRWTTAKGIHLCETCGADLRDYDTPEVPELWRDELAFAAGIISPSAHRRGYYRRRVPQPLRGLSDGEVFDLAIAMGQLVALEEDQLRPFGDEDPRVGDFQRLASGAAMVLGWSDQSLLAYLTGEQTKQVIDCRSSSSLKRFRRLYWDAGTLPAVRQVLLETMPWLVVPEAPYPVRAKIAREKLERLTGHQAAAELNIEVADLARLRDNDLLRPMVVGGRDRIHGWYDLADIRAAKRHLAARMSYSEAQQRYGLRRIDLEQLVAAQLVALNDDPFVRALHDNEQLSRQSVEDLFDKLRKCCTPLEGAKDGWMPLRYALRMFGGGPKPVVPIINAALSGREPVLALINSEKGFAIDRAFLKISTGVDWAGVNQALMAGWCPDRFLSDQEAIDIMNCNPNEYYKSVRALLCVDDERGVSAESVVKFAAAHISSLEIAARTGETPSDVPLLMRYRAQAPVVGSSFWDRDAVAAHVEPDPFFVARDADGSGDGIATTDDEWSKILDLMPCTRQRHLHDRRLIDSVFWKLATGRRWADLPNHYGCQRERRQQYRYLVRTGGIERLKNQLSGTAFSQ